MKASLFITQLQCILIEAENPLLEKPEYSSVSAPSSSQFSSSSVQSKDTINTQISRSSHLEPPSPFPHHHHHQLRPADTSGDGSTIKYMFLFFLIHKYICKYIIISKNIAGTETAVCHNAARRPSTVSFSFRRNSITPNGLLR